MQIEQYLGCTVLWNEMYQRTKEKKISKQIEFRTDYYIYCRMQFCCYISLVLLCTFFLFVALSLIIWLYDYSRGTPDGKHLALHAYALAAVRCRRRRCCLCGLSAVAQCRSCYYYSFFFLFCFCLCCFTFTLHLFNMLNVSASVLLSFAYQLYKSKDREK